MQLHATSHAALHSLHDEVLDLLVLAGGPITCVFLHMFPPADRAAGAAPTPRGL